MKTLVPDSPFSGVCNFIKKEALAQVFPCEFCKISKTTFSYRTHKVATSVNIVSKTRNCSHSCNNISNYILFYLFYIPSKLILKCSVILYHFTVPLRSPFEFYRHSMTLIVLELIASLIYRHPKKSVLGPDCLNLL